MVEITIELKNKVLDLRSRRTWVENIAKKTGLTIDQVMKVIRDDRPRRKY